jgi:Fur family peroxide stress response transcriptional regulator
LPWGRRRNILGVIPIIDMKEHKRKGENALLYRRSRQRDRILALLRSTGSHPTANWIYAKLRKEFPDLSMGTVYRNIGILIQQGFINRIDFGSTFDRFDANTAPHYHFICEKCGAIADLETPVDDSLNARVKPSTGFKVNRHEIEFYGLCEKCAHGA